MTEPIRIGQHASWNLKGSLLEAIRDYRAGFRDLQSHPDRIRERGQVEHDFASFGFNEEVRVDGAVIFPENSRVCHFPHHRA